MKQNLSHLYLTPHTVPSPTYPTSLHILLQYHRFSLLPLSTLFVQSVQSSAYWLHINKLSRSTGVKKAPFTNSPYVFVPTARRKNLFHPPKGFLARITRKRPVLTVPTGRAYFAHKSPIFKSLFFQKVTKWSLLGFPYSPVLNARPDKRSSLKRTFDYPKSFINVSHQSRTQFTPTDSLLQPSRHWLTISNYAKKTKLFNSFLQNSATSSNIEILQPVSSSVDFWRSHRSSYRTLPLNPYSFLGNYYMPNVTSKRSPRNKFISLQKNLLLLESKNLPRFSIRDFVPLAPRFQRTFFKTRRNLSRSYLRQVYLRSKLKRGDSRQFNQYVGTEHVIRSFTPGRVFKSISKAPLTQSNPSATFTTTQRVTYSPLNVTFQSLSLQNAKLTSLFFKYKYFSALSSTNTRLTSYQKRSRLLRTLPLLFTTRRFRSRLIRRSRWLKFAMAKIVPFLLKKKKLLNKSRRNEFDPKLFTRLKFVSHVRLSLQRSLLRYKLKSPRFITAATDNLLIQRFGSQKSLTQQLTLVSSAKKLLIQAHFRSPNVQTKPFTLKLSFSFLSRLLSRSTASSYSPTTNLSGKIRFNPSSSLTFKRSPFFFVTRISTNLNKQRDYIAASHLDSDLTSKPLVFPDANKIKVSIFRQLNRQKLQFKNIFNSFHQLANRTSFFNQQQTQPISGSYVNTKYSSYLSNPLLTGSQGFSSLESLSTSSNSFLKHRQRSLNSSFLSSEPRITRIRFKPGYGRIWRNARRSVQEIVNVYAKYQYRLTPRIQKLYFATRRMTSPNYLTLEYSLMVTQFSFDKWFTKDFLVSNLVFLNGIVCSNPRTVLFTGDLVQLLVNFKFYVTRRWIQNWSTLRRNRATKIFFRKNKPLGFDRNIFSVRTLPEWFFDLRFASSDIPKCFELDFFTLSFFVLYNRLGTETLMSSRATRYPTRILNMYNWKYIT